MSRGKISIIKNNNVSNLYQKKIINEIFKLKNKSLINQKVFYQFLKLVRSQKKSLTKQEGAQKHICAFFLPVNLETQSIYLVHHIKANDWIPPGGHINNNELPENMVKREFEEELGQPLLDEKIELFDLSIKDINRPYQNCITHYDFWYLVYTKKIPFKFLRKEFYDAGWFKLIDGAKKIKLKKYRDIVKKLHSIL